MSDAETALDAEFSAIQKVHTALEPLDEAARTRVVGYIIARLNIPITGQVKPQASKSAPLPEEDTSPVDRKKDTPNYQTFADLHHAAQPKTNPQRALVAGYWFQVCQKAESFDGFSVNKELKHLGFGVDNITGAIDTLKNQSPAQALQLKKSGKAKQARKLYKITDAGIKEVERMINGSD